MANTQYDAGRRARLAAVIAGYRAVFYGSAFAPLDAADLDAELALSADARGDTLLTFLIHEIGDTQVGDHDDAVSRLTSVVQQVEGALSALVALAEQEEA